jgi:magnesium-transporting ATPase (P-type)
MFSPTNGGGAHDVLLEDYRVSVTLLSGVGIVMSTGFCTQKGELLRSISSSDNNVSVNNKEAMVFMAALLVFAVAASSYVLKHSWYSGKTSHYKLLMRCIMIITAVSPSNYNSKFRRKNLVDVDAGYST